MSSQITALPAVPAPEGAQLYGVKDGTDHSIPVGAPLGVCPLDAGGQVPAARIPAIAIVSVTPVASEAEMLALDAEVGDVAIRTDTSQTYIRNAGQSGTVTDWTLLLSPTDAVTSVFGRTGVVTAADGDYDAAQIVLAAVAELPGVSRVQAAIAQLAGALAAKAPLAAPALTGAATLNGQPLGINGMPLVTQDANYAFAATDNGFAQRKTLTTARTYTVNNSVFAGGEVFGAMNDASSGNITLAQGSGVTLYLAGTTTSGNRTIAPRGYATVWMVSASVGYVSGPGVT